jgi:hypothetical protein
VVFGSTKVAREGERGRERGERGEREGRERESLI